MSFTDILEGAYRLYREHFWVFLGIAAIVHVPEVILSSFVEPRFDGPWTPDVWWRLLLFSQVGWIANAIESAALTAAVAHAYLGRQVTIDVGYARAWPMLVPLLGASFVTALGVVAGAMLFVVPGIVLMLRWMFYSQVLAVEGGGAGGSLHRSGVLTRGIYGRLFLLTAVFIVASVVIGLPMGALLSGAETPIIGPVLRGVPYLLLSPLWKAALILAYFDARIRKEGFDLEALAREMPAGR